jgi:hypothetical protein
VATTDKNFKVKRGLTVAAEGITFSDGSTLVSAEGLGGAGAVDGGSPSSIYSDTLDGGSPSTVF